MKKIGLFILSLLFVIPFSVNAAEYKVETLESSVSGSTISYNGTMEDGAHAVTCKLYNSENTEVDLLSSAVDSNKFEGSFENVSEGKYVVSCANYEGGEIKSVDVTVGAATTGETTKTVPTGDNVKTYVIIAIVSIIAIAGATVYLKKRVKNN